MYYFSASSNDQKQRFRRLRIFSSIYSWVTTANSTTTFSLLFKIYDHFKNFPYGTWRTVYQDIHLVAYSRVFYYLRCRLYMDVNNFGRFLPHVTIYVYLAISLTVSLRIPESGGQSHPVLGGGGGSALAGGCFPSLWECGTTNTHAQVGQELQDIRETKWKVGDDT